MKILYVLEYYYPHIGGVEKFFQKIAEGCARNGHRVRVVTVQIEKTDKHEYVNDVEIIRLKMPNFGRRYWFTFLAFFKLLKLAKECDIIHTTTYNAAWPAWLVGKFFGKKIILTVHEVWADLWHRLPGMNIILAWLHRAFEWFILKLPFDYYVTDSEYFKNALMKMRKINNNISQIYLGIDYDFFNPDLYNPDRIRDKLKLQDSFSYLYYGRPGWAKGVDDLVKAVPEIVKKIPNSKLILILSKDPKTRYQAIMELIRKLQMEDNILMLDSVPYKELPEYIMAPDCVVVPSLSEGFGFSAAEAGALKRPIVMTRTGSLPEVVSGRVSFCKPQNSASIAGAVVNAYSNKFSLIPDKKFLWQDTITNYEKIYRSLMNK